MLRMTFLSAALVLLAACQTTQPQRDYDSSRNFAEYRSWTWADPAINFTPANDPRIGSDLVAQRLKDAIASQLDARGLRPAASPEQADLKVRADMVIDEREQMVTTNYGVGLGTGYWGVWGGGPMMSETRSVDYQTATLQIDLIDAEDNQLVWRGSSTEVVRDQSQSPAERTRSAHELAARVLTGYPPN
ncbi:protein of unknown function [Halopseudomonas xinjiangensis]|uniref:DUF4136 domain-containing protein n=1 Tax=Halopseudomonas xinjiangensis TaxID=487184 RepID=A0A1H1Y3S0_9GAMM|nr:DUF4136 domain-containing protein [Halopseudomonas xinjiangensis]SDT15879.1 protein of unknown function [Halopseudomonas xinjiangensis]